MRSLLALLLCLTALLGAESYPITPGHPGKGWMLTSLQPGLSLMEIHVHEDEHEPRFDEMGIPLDSGQPRDGYSSALAFEGAGEWHIESSVTKEVHSGELVALRLAYRSQVTGPPMSAEIVALDAKGRWAAEALEGLTLAPSDGQQYVDKTFQVPPGVGRLGVRLKGRGATLAWLEIPDLSMQLENKDRVEAPFTLRQGNFSVELSEEGLALQNGTGARWKTQGWGRGKQVAAFSKRNNGPYESGIVWFFLRDGEILVQEFALMDDPAHPKIFVSSRTGHPEKFSGVDWLGPWRLEKEDRWLLPLNEGMVFSPQELQKIWPYDLPVGAGHFVSMPWLGLQRGQEVLTQKVDQQEDLRWHAERSPEGASLVWRGGELRIGGGLEIAVDVHRAARVPARAKTDWKRFGPQSMVQVSLAQKVSMTPQVARLAGAVNLYWWRHSKYWEREDPPKDLVKELKALGIDRVLWSQEASKAGVKAVQDEGWLAGRYENFQDVYPTDTPLNWANKEGWPEQAMRDLNGNWIKGWRAEQGGKTFYAGVRCPKAGEKYVEDQLRRGTIEHGYDTVFFDTTTASGPRACSDPEHPLTVFEELGMRMQQLRKATYDMHLITGSESGLELAMPSIHYFEGMLSPSLFRLPNSGYDLQTRLTPTAEFLDYMISPRHRAPFFELAYHDSYVGYEYWGDAANRLPQYWRRRDMFSVLYGQPQLWHFDPETWAELKHQAVKSYRTWSPVVRHLFGQRMTDWKVLDQVGDIQETDWEDGSVITVDFTKDRYTLAGPVAKAAKVIAP